MNIADINASSVLTEDAITTCVCATRCGERIDFWWADDCDGFGELGMRDEPLTLAEAIAMVDATIAAQATSEIVNGGDRSGYLYTATVRVSSAFYAHLRA